MIQNVKIDDDTAKREIIDLLGKKDYKSVSDIANKLSIPHLRTVEYIDELKNRGILVTDKNPPFIKLKKQN
jgi:predicted ArsR family transcriptional regulator